MTTISCKQCGIAIEITEALQGQIEAQVLASEHARHEQELLQVRRETEVSAQSVIQSAANAARKQAEEEIALTKSRLEAEAASAQKRAAASQETMIRSLREDAENAKQEGKQLREQLSALMAELRQSKQAQNNAEIDMQRKLTEEEGKIRQEALKSADERYRLRQAEVEKQLADTQKALEDAQRKANQGSQQNQGEVLELDLENRLRDEFPFDEIVEVKKGQRGADVKQLVRNQMGAQCGILLWETKNGKWQPAWIPKFKQDIREANANVGVIVSQEIPDEMGEMRHIEGNVWVCSPRLAPRLAMALRLTILQVDGANKMNAGKDAKMESLYQFLVGPEFKHRVEAIVENYTVLQDEIEREKRASALKWARQEKAIRAVIDNTIGMYGDLQGITNRALPAIKSLEMETEEEIDIFSRI